jgi:hypothetical protein
MEDFAPDLIHRCLELRLTAEASKFKFKLVLITVIFKGGSDQLPITGKTADAYQPLRNVGRVQNKIHATRLDGAARHPKKGG